MSELIEKKKDVPRYSHGEHNGWPVVMRSDGEAIDDFVGEFNVLSDHIAKLETELNTCQIEYGDVRDSYVFYKQKATALQEALERLGSAKPINSSYPAITDDWHNRIDYANKARREL